MSRVSVIEKLYMKKKKSIFEFDYDALSAPPILSIMTVTDIGDLNEIATSLKYNARIEKKYKMIDEIMVRRGFKFAHRGTNRCVYNFLDLPIFVSKIALDRVGIHDNPAEFKNQNYLKPFCCKIHEVTPTGVLGFVERVNPVTSLQEFYSIKDDVFNLYVTKVYGKYVVDDIGVTKFMNIGVRYLANGCRFGPVLIDYPYVFPLDGNKLKCGKYISTPFGEMPCGGDIDVNDGFDYLYCTKCGRIYQARDLAKEESKLIMFGENSKGGKMRAFIINKETGKTIFDSGRASSTYVSKEDYEAKNSNCKPGEYTVSSTVKIKRTKGINEIRDNIYSDLKIEYYNKLREINNDKEKRAVEVSKTIKAKDIEENQNSSFNSEDYLADKNGITVSKTIDSNDEILKDIEAKVIPEMSNSYEQNTTVNEEEDAENESITTESEVVEDGSESSTEAFDETSDNENDDKITEEVVANVVNEYNINIFDVIRSMNNEIDPESLEEQEKDVYDVINDFNLDIEKICTELSTKYGWTIVWDSNENDDEITEEISENNDVNNQYNSSNQDYIYEEEKPNKRLTKKERRALKRERNKRKYNNSEMSGF